MDVTNSNEHEGSQAAKEINYWLWLVDMYFCLMDVRDLMHVKALSMYLSDIFTYTTITDNPSHTS